MALPLHDRAIDGNSPALVRITEEGLVFTNATHQAEVITNASLRPKRPLAEGEQYRFHFDMTKCIGCRSCEIACNEQNGNPADIQWRRIGELEGGSYPETQRHYLSMGCNHCLDADCLRGCPVDAYQKDPVTGIVLHSADACIGCQYCVWNCPYSVPQFNAERGVVGKCDMCKGRLEDSLEPACVNACPEGAIEIEIVNMLDWRENFSSADSPGMPAAKQTISTTRITLPENTGTVLERVDGGQIPLEHAHLSLVVMTTLMQAVAGSLWTLLLWRGLDTVRLTLLVILTSIALTISTLHLGRPAYAWRALKMWRRSWLSREVLLFTLFFGALAAATACTAATALRITVPFHATAICSWAAATFALAGTIASASIYLVQARPSWNMRHTPVDFLLTAVFLGSLLSYALGSMPLTLRLLPFLTEAPLQHAALEASFHLTLLSGVAWLLNHAIRLFRLRRSKTFESRASFSLLSSVALRPHGVASFALIIASMIFAGSGDPIAALGCGLLGVLLARYLFFVTVVPLNMALTFVRTRHA